MIYRYMRWDTLLIIMFLISCENNNGNCKEDQRFKDKYTRSIEIIKNYHNSPSNDSLVNNYAKAYGFIYSITRIRGQETVGYRGIYYKGNSKKKLKEDVDNWINWYEENKCEVTLDIADSIYQDYIKLNKIE